MTQSLNIKEYRTVFKNQRQKNKKCPPLHTMNEIEIEQKLKSRIKVNKLNNIFFYLIT